MGLILPHVQQAFLGTNAGASLSAPGQTLTASATPHTKGTVVEISSGATRDWYGLHVMIMNDSVSATFITNLVDVLVGPSGSEQPIIPSIIGTHGISSNLGGSWSYFWPVFIPGGTRVSARTQSNVASRNTNIAVWEPSGFGTVPPYKTFQRVIAIGADVTTSGGLAHLGGSTGAFSTFTNIGSPLPFDIKALAMMVAMDNNTSMNALGYNWQVGIGGTQIGGIATQFSGNNTEYVGHQVPNVPFYIQIPAGTQLQIRVACTGTAQSFQHSLYGFA